MKETTAGTPGETAPSSARRWVITSILAIALVVVMVALLYPTFKRQQQYAALHNHGVTTTARIEYCATAGNNRPSVVTVTCPGLFTVGRTTAVEDILGLPAPLQQGDRIVVIVDPSDLGNVYLASDVRTGYRSGWLTSNTAYAALAAVLLVLVVASQVIVVRRKRSRPMPSPPPGRTRGH